METMTEQVDSWALTLATAVEDQNTSMDMDIVFVGHVDGCVIVYHYLLKFGIIGSNVANFHVLYYYYIGVLLCGPPHFPQSTRVPVAVETLGFL
jgi:predicted alpha/beta hydrolase family esterase